MKVLFVSDTNYPMKDGVVTYMNDVIPGLEKKYEVKTFVPKIGSRGDAPVIKKKIFGYYVTIPKGILSAVKRSDIIFSNSPMSNGLAAVFLGRHYGKRVIIFCHHDEKVLMENVFPPLKKSRNAVDKVMKAYYERADMCIFATEKFYMRLKRLGIPEDQLVHNPFSVDTNLFRPYASPLKEEYPGKVALYVGRMSREKNVEEILEHAKLMTDWNFLFVGDGYMLDHYRKNSPANCKFTGGLERAELPDYYNVADVFVHLSNHESQSFTVMEAMACGLPVVTKRSEGRFSFLKKGNYIPYSGNLRRDISMLDSTGINAKDEMEKYSWERHVEVLEKVFDGV